MGQSAVVYYTELCPFFFETDVTFDSILAGLGRNQLYDACCSAQTAHKPVLKNLEKQTTGANSLLT